MINQFNNKIIIILAIVTTILTSLIVSYYFKNMSNDSIEASAKINERLLVLAENIRNADYENAYNLFSSEYQSKKTKQQFQEEFSTG